MKTDKPTPRWHDDAVMADAIERHDFIGMAERSLDLGYSGKSTFSREEVIAIVAIHFEHGSLGWRLGFKEGMREAPPYPKQRRHDN